MIAAALPEDEVHRLDALHSLELLDSPADADFDAVVQLAQALFQVPICLISLIDQDRQWFKACIGLDDSETSREVSFCAHAILQPANVFVVLDATQDQRFHDNPLVSGAPHIRFYAGAPILLPSGYPIGTVCIIDSVSRSDFGPEAMRQLKALADVALNAISLRALRGQLDLARAIVDRHQVLLQATRQPVALADAAGQVQDCNLAFEALNLEAEAWLPDAAHAEDGIYILPQGRFRILRDAEGFILIGLPS